MNTHEIPEARQKVGAVTLRELSAGLVFPHLFRALGISVNPKMVFVGFLVALFVFVGGWALDGVWVEALDPDSGLSPWAPLQAFWPTGGPSELAARMGLAGLAFSDAPAWWTALLVVWTLPFLALGSVVVSRMAALEFASAKEPRLRANLAFALSRWRSLLVAFITPVAILLVLQLALWLLGLIFFTSDFMANLGAVIYPLFLILGTLLAITALLSVIGGLMLGPAIAIEDTDGVDAIQRAFAYVTNRPLTVALYLAILGVVLYVAYWLIQEIFRFAIDSSLCSSGAIDYANQADLEVVNDTVEENRPFSARAIGFWVQAFWLIFIGWVFSYVWTAGTLLYLAMRRAHDEHDMFEIPSDTPVRRVIIEEPADTKNAPDDGGGEIN